MRTRWPVLFFVALAACGPSGTSEGAPADLDDGEDLPPEATLPDVRTRRLLLVGLQPAASYEIQVTSGFAPGSPVWRASAEAGDEGTLGFPWDGVRDGRLRLKRLR